jgi:hypothetical protein
MFSEILWNLLTTLPGVKVVCTVALGDNLAKSLAGPVTTSTEESACLLLIGSSIISRS